ncbi:hypothetical protein [Citrobacter sp. FDAARGOS_156]|uniref:hypothetical protein n=1 Tax=Citrobacter sp. FDAARGOS_156 TaxID=1702170 RepID=UPI001900B670|nr:hypothetical protein [Citrobacter sp. FDAARGOS_156]MBJ8924064.1 hypothetical protein [Citrobacter sp. FDAARGOS_156]
MTTNNHPAHGPVSLDRPDDESLEILITLRREIVDRHAREGNFALQGAHTVLLNALIELQERRKADSDEPVSFDALNAAVAEVTGGNQHAWDAEIYKGHHPVPFMNYNSLARIVDKYRVPQPAPAVPDEKRDDDGSVTSDFDHGWNACRAAMLQAGNSPVNPDGKVMVLVEPTLTLHVTDWVPNET